MAFRRSFYILFIFSGLIISGTAECDDVQLYSCLNVIPHDAFGKYFEWDQSKENILLYITRIHDKFCEVSEPLMNCVLDYTKNCPDEDLKDIGKFIKGRSKLLHNVCAKDVQLRQEFLDSIECLSENQNDIFEECEKQVQKPEEEKEDCKSYWDTAECMYKTSGLFCGEDASALLKLFTGPANALTKKRCFAKF